MRETNNYCLKQNNKNGFSLVELSIVLVILGLLTGGILTGQSLIRASELRAITTESSQIETAVMTFKGKYFALPGDMSNATSFWSAADGGDGLGTDCADATSSGGSTCNGNGNEWIEGAEPPFIPTTSPELHNGMEWFHSWVHLSNAGLIEGQYTGTRAGDPRLAIPGENIFASKISGAGYTLMSLTFAAGHGRWYSGNYKPMVFLGLPSSNIETDVPFLKPEETWNIDKKIDDGRPGYGRIRTQHHDGNCVTQTGDNNRSTAQYNLAVQSVSCALIYSFSDPGVL